jgi:hypothetical protein
MANASNDSSDLSQRVTAIGLTPRAGTGMQYRHVGRSGLIASALGVGCFPFGGFVDIAGSRARPGARRPAP